MIDLDIKDPRGNIIKHQLGPGKHTLGKSPRCDIVLMDNFVSRHHADIIITEDEIYLVDFNSTNGVWVNEMRIFQAIRVSESDKIRFGKQVLALAKSSYVFNLRMGKPFDASEIEIPADTDNVVSIPISRIRKNRIKQEAGG